tara:strand:- start:1388 stop:1609 length:222 start_codon:yes stop_codon:yes gene_type:complete
MKRELSIGIIASVAGSIIFSVIGFFVSGANEFISAEFNSEEISLIVGVGVILLFSALFSYISWRLFLSKNRKS